MSDTGSTVEPERTPYERCSRCGGHGILDWGDSFPDCSDCGGGGFVRARDERGRFTTLPLKS